MGFGKLIITDNKAARLGASLFYNSICVINEFGEYETLLLTDSELRRMRHRGKNNPEDSIEISWFGKAVIAVCRWLRIF